MVNMFEAQSFARNDSEKSLEIVSERGGKKKDNDDDIASFNPLSLSRGAKSMAYKGQAVKIEFNSNKNAKIAIASPVSPGFNSMNKNPRERSGSKASVAAIDDSTKINLLWKNN